LALKFLSRALSAAVGEQYIRLFLDMGPNLMPLLYEAANQNIQPGYCGQLLALFPTFTQPPGARKTAPAGSELVEPLSERELEVLRLVAEGLTNREIGLRLYLSPNTIKRHTLNIYAKLGVHGRTEAVTVARNLGLLP